MSARLYQQVNLYQPIFRRQRQIFSAATLLGIVGGVAAALLAIWAVGVWQVGALESEARRLEAQQQAMTERLAAFDTSAGERRRSEITQDIERLSAELEAQQRLLERLRNQPLASAAGFSPHLAALARRHRDGVWLTGVMIEGHSGALHLSGRALSPDRVAAYLQDLAREPALHGQRFELLSIERSDGTPGVDFEVVGPSSERPEQGADRVAGRGANVASARQ